MRIGWLLAGAVAGKEGGGRIGRERPVRDGECRFSEKVFLREQGRGVLWPGEMELWPSWSVGDAVMRNRKATEAPWALWFQFMEEPQRRTAVWAGGISLRRIGGCLWRGRIGFSAEQSASLVEQGTVLGMEQTVVPNLLEALG